MTLRALIFDVDGTLADTERDGHRVAFTAAFRDAHLAWRWDEDAYGELLRVTGGRERILHDMRTRISAYVMDDDCRDAVARELHVAKTRHYAALLEEGTVALRPGVARLIHEARAAGITLAIATTTSRVNVEALLRCTLGADALGWFTAVVCGEDVLHKKPDPEVYRAARGALPFASMECLALEDSTAGLQAARGAGIPTLVTRNDYTRGHDFAGALAVVESLGGDGDAEALGLERLRAMHRHALRVEAAVAPSECLLASTPKPR